MKRIFIISIVTILLSSSLAHGQKNTNVFVADFVTRNLIKNDTTAKLTHDFEAALIQYGNYNVLENRNFDRLLSELDKERAISDITNFSELTLKNLKTQQANLVIFGEVFDDIQSGQISITVTFQKFNRIKVIIKNVLIPRGKINDAKTRQDAMENLVKELRDKTSTVKRITSNGFIFELKECRKSERNVSCDFLITNNGEDRKLIIYNYYFSDRRSRIFDDLNTEVLPHQIILASRRSENTFVENMLISGHPAEATLHFKGISSRATAITRFDLKCQEEEHNTIFTVTFRNIPLK